MSDLPPLPERLPVPVVDNHTHLDIGRDGCAPPPIEQILADSASVGVDRMVQVGCDLPSSRFTVKVIDEFPQLLGAVAVHPNEAPRLDSDGETASTRVDLAELAQHPRVR